MCKSPNKQYFPTQLNRIDCTAQLCFVLYHKQIKNQTPQTSLNLKLLF